MRKQSISIVQVKTFWKISSSRGGLTPTHLAYALGAYALCFYPHQWKFSSTPVRTVFAINTTEFYYPHRTVRLDMVKHSDLGY